MMTKEELLTSLDYNPDTGIFRHKKNTNWRKIGDIAGSKDAYGYIQIMINNKSYKAHRLAWFYIHGFWPLCQIDHINGDRRDNRISNLRDVSPNNNQQNRRQAQKNNKTGLLGVSMKGNKWVAHIKINGKKKHIGYYSTPDAAYAAYVAVKRALHSTCTI